MRDEFLQVMDRVPNEALKVFLYLQGRASLDTRVGMTQQEISRATRLSVGAVRDSLGWLSSPSYIDAGLKTQEEIAPFISLRKVSNYFEVILLEPYAQGEKIKFTFEDTDSRRIATLEQEVRRLATSRKQNSRLSLYIRGERGALLKEMENDLGRGLSQEEAFLMGGVMHMYGVERIRTAWRTKAAEMDKPIVGIYATFMGRAHGASVVKQEQKKEVSYPRFTRTEELV